MSCIYMPSWCNSNIHLEMEYIGKNNNKEKENNINWIEFTICQIIFTTNWHLGAKTSTSQTKA